jgi:hypothetical protein
MAQEFKPYKLLIDMKQYKIYGFDYGYKTDWIFECKEVEENGLILLIGKFKGYGKKYTFIKNKKDVLLNQ